jgi:hypothetical protein
MPEWFDPLMNTSLASGLIGFLCWGLVRIVKFFAPFISEAFKGLKNGYETHTELIDVLKTNAIKQTAFMERSVQMQDADGKFLREVHAATVKKNPTETVTTP